MRRKNQLANGEVYHVFNRSIAEFKILNTEQDYQRMLYLFKYFQVTKPPTKFSKFIDLEAVKQGDFFSYFDLITKEQEKIIQIISFCLMPTHIHLTAKQLDTNGISLFMSNVLNSYARYFNTKHHRKGPLWESKFQNVFVKTNEQLLHLGRYQHLNPVTALLVGRPEQWKYSSYNEYISGEEQICQFNDLLKIDPKQYRKFVNDRISYQRRLAKIKKLAID